MRSIVNTCGSTAGKMTWAQICLPEAPKVRAVFINLGSTDWTAATVDNVSRKYTPVKTTKIAVGLPMPKATMPTGIQAIGAAHHHAPGAREDGHRDRHALLAEADAKVAVDGEADERRRRREERGRHPAARGGKLPQRHKHQPGNERRRSSFSHLCS
jgi:hypothetical protein